MSLGHLPVMYPFTPLNPYSNRPSARVIKWPDLEQYTLFIKGNSNLQPTLFWEVLWEKTSGAFRSAICLHSCQVTSRLCSFPSSAYYSVLHAHIEGRSRERAFEPVRQGRIVLQYMFTYSSKQIWFQWWDKAALGTFCCGICCFLWPWFSRGQEVVQGQALCTA